MRAIHEIHCRRHRDFATMAGEADGDHAVDSVVKNVGIGSSFTLPCGYRLSNRLVKAAMTEVLADPLRCEPNQHHERLYVWQCVTA